MEQEKDKQKIELDDQFMTKGQLIAFAYDVGFAIIIPLVILALLGRFLDQKMGTSPLFLIIGILLSLVSTGVMIYKKTKNFIK
ncbi:MAG: AtpZ/AtpI family protein [Candidatus Paceibacterota bacterium]